MTFCQKNNIFTNKDGFGKEFIQQSEAWYTAQGLGYIEIKSTAADGARHWARAGYDFSTR